MRAWLSQPGQVLRPPPDVWARLDPQERQAVDDRLARNTLHPTPVDDIPEPDAGGGSPIVAPPAGNPEYETSSEETRRIQATDDDPAQWEKDRAISDAIVRRAVIDTQNGKGDDVRTAPDVRAEIERGLTSNDLQERLKWARAPLHKYKSSLSDSDFAYLADLQRRISPYDGNPREGVGHPIGTLEQHADLAGALAAGRLARPALAAGRTALRRIDDLARRPEHPPNQGFAETPQKVTLPPGTKIDRYGGSHGKFLSPAGVPASARSLPKGTEARPLNTYEVVKPIEVDSGPAAAWYGQPGGGTQYYLGKRTVQDLIDSGHIRPYK